MELTDKELLERLIALTGWNQYETADQLYLAQPQISRVLNERQRLRPAIRKRVLELIQQHAQQPA